MSSDPKSPPEPKSTEPAAADPTVTTVLGDAASALFEQQVVLIFDTETGLLVTSNETAQLQLGLDPDSAMPPAFTEMVRVEGQLPDSFWDAAQEGGPVEWSGQLVGCLDLTVDVDVIATQAVLSASRKGVVVVGKPVQAIVMQPAGPSSLEAAVGMISYDMDGNITDINDRAMIALEAYDASLVGRNHDTLWPSEATTAQSYIEFWEKLRKGRIIEGRHVHVSAVGSPVWLRSTFVPVKGADGHPVAVRQYLVDVSAETFEAQAAIAFSDALRSAVSITEYDADGHVTAMNEAMAQSLGYTAEEAIGLHDHRFCDPEFARGTTYRVVWSELGVGRMQQIVIPQVGKDQRKLWARSTLLPIIGVDGRLAKVVKIAEDVTESHEGFLESVQKLSAFETAFMTAEFDLSGRITAADSKFVHAFQTKATDLIGQTHASLCSKEEAASRRYEGLWDKLRDGETVSVTLQHLTAKGEQIWLQSHYAPLRTPNGRLLKILSIHVETTLAKAMEFEFDVLKQSLDRTHCIAYFDPAGALMHINDNFLKATGYTRANDAKSLTRNSFLHSEDDTPEANRQFWETMKSNRPLVMRARRKTALGKDVLAGHQPSSPARPIG